MAGLFLLYRTICYGLLFDLANMLNYSFDSKTYGQIVQLSNPDCTRILRKQSISLRCCTFRPIRRANSNEISPAPSARAFKSSSVLFLSLFYGRYLLYADI